LPSFYPAKERLDAVHAGDAAFNENTHKNTAYKSLANRVEEAHDDGSSVFKYISDTL
jgi:collagenase-like PrtC family protease